ncbi:protein LLP homolog isoform X2 [Frieseomelitta varia]|uniref:protein LLP homolog isoform X2 n=1 Tax=Frieseomelitta varia TaxID=561572 RepID=UPI001CB6ADDA|nr:protein LLP homolog isoform X2 [Frieseomelitta varia]
MAKSLRSKWRRKCRAIKRVRYGAKELERLKKTLGIDENGSQDVEMSEMSKIATVVDAKTIKENEHAKEDEQAKENEQAKEDDQAETNGETMDVDIDGRLYNKRTMRDQYGNYPVWMNKRKIAKHKKGRAKSQKGNFKPHKRLTRRQKKGMKQK